MNFNQNNPMFNAFGGYQNFQMQFNNFVNSLGQQDPQALVQQMLNSGKMSPQQFEQLRQQANMLTGMNF